MFLHFSSPVGKSGFPLGFNFYTLIAFYPWPTQPFPADCGTYGFAEPPKCSGLLFQIKFIQIISGDLCARREAVAYAASDEVLRTGGGCAWVRSRPEEESGWSTPVDCFKRPTDIIKPLL